MMNAEVTAENRPAYTRLSALLSKFVRTHEDQGRIQILVAFLEELLVVLFGYPTVVFVEPSPMIFLSGDRLLFGATRRVSQRRTCRAGNKLPVCWLSRSLFHTFSDFLLLFRNLSVVES